MARKEFTGAASPLVLDADINTGATTFTTTGTTTGWPTGASDPFVVELDRGTDGTAEKVLIQTRSGNNFTVATRGYDGTTAQSHDAGVAVEHVIDALTIDEANAHVNDDTRDDHSQYLNTTRHDVTARHAIGTAIAAGTPGAIAIGDTASEGVANAVARSDHRHAAPSFGTSITAEAIGDTASAGVATTPARSDHRHAMPAFGSPVAEAVGSTASDGVATTVARSDHRHAMPAFYSAPSGSQPGDAAAEGVSVSIARGDHVHSREYYPNLAQHTAQDFSDQSVAISGNDVILSDTFTVGTGGRLCNFTFTCQVRRSSGASLDFGGNLVMYIDGVATGAPDRLTSQTHDNILKGSLNVWATLAAGSHTITVKGSCDPSSGVGMYYFNRAYNAAVIGG